MGKGTSLAGTAKLYSGGLQQRRPAGYRYFPLFLDFSFLASSLEAVFRQLRQDTPRQDNPTNPDFPSIPTVGAWELLCYAGSTHGKISHYSQLAQSSIFSGQ